MCVCVCVCVCECVRACVYEPFRADERMRANMHMSGELHAIWCFSETPKTFSHCINYIF